MLRVRKAYIPQGKHCLTVKGEVAIISTSQWPRHKASNNTVVTINPERLIETTGCSHCNRDYLRILL